MGTTPSSSNNNTSKSSSSDFQRPWTGFCTIQDLRWEKVQEQWTSFQNEILLSWRSLTVSLSFPRFDTEHFFSICRGWFVFSLRCRRRFIFTFRGVVFVKVSYHMVTTFKFLMVKLFELTTHISLLLPKRYTKTASRYVIRYLKCVVLLYESCCIDQSKGNHIYPSRCSFCECFLWHADYSLVSYGQITWTCLRWFLSMALRIPTAHDFRVISERKWSRARAQRRKFPSS